MSSNIVSLVELQFAPTLYWATAEAVTDAAGHVYEARLADHPELTRSLPEDWFGVPDDEEYVITVSAVDDTQGGTHVANDVATIFRTDRRNAVVILRRKELDSGTVVDRAAGRVQYVEFKDDGTIDVHVKGTLTDTLATLYPRLTVTPATFPTATSEVFALEKPLPIHFGAHREHTPCLYVEQDDVQLRYRYVGACDLAPSAGTPGVCMPYINDAYIGTTLGASLIGRGEYRQVWDVKLSDLLNGGITLTIQAGGALPIGTVCYTIEPISGGGPTKAPIGQSQNTTSGNQKARVSWSYTGGVAQGFRIYRNDASMGSLWALVAEVPGRVTSFTDDGSLTPIRSGLAQGVDFGVKNMTGNHTVDLLFDTPEWSQSSQLAPVLADVEFTELGWDASTQALWLGRESTRDQTPNFNFLKHGAMQAFWHFADMGDPTLSLTHAAGTNDLRGRDLTGYTPQAWTADAYRLGPFGKPVAHFDGNRSLAIPNANCSGLNIPNNTASLHIDARVKPAAGSSLSALMSIVARRLTSTSAGYELRLENGVAVAIVSDGTSTATARGTSVLDGAYHTVGFDLNRSTQILSVLVDGVIEGQASTSAVGSPSNTAIFQVGSGPSTGMQFLGDMDWIAVSNAAGSGVTYQLGKANQALNAFDFTAGNHLEILDSKQVGLSPGTGNFTIEGWVYWQGGATASCIAAKYDGTNGGYLFYINANGTLTSLFQRPDTTNGAATSTATVPTNKWTYVAMVVTRGTSIACVVNDAIATTSLSGETVSSINTTDPFVFGARDTSDTQKFNGYIDELRFSTTARALTDCRAAYYLGRRNFVRQARALLTSAVHGPGLTVNGSSSTELAAGTLRTWDQAESDVAGVQSGALVTDGALVEQKPLREHLNELLKVRGARITMSTAGALDCTADTQKSVAATFGHLDGVWNNVQAAPKWSQKPVAETSKTFVARYRLRRSASGGADNLVLRTAGRSVFAFGKDEVDDVPTIRDRTAADVYAYYRTQRRLANDTTVDFNAGSEAIGLNPGDLITLYDTPAGASGGGVTLEVQKIRDRGIDVGITARGWSSNIYGYTSAALPTDVSPENTPDYSATPPPSPTSVSASAAATIQADGRRVWTVTVTWAAPSTSVPIADYLVEWLAPGDSVPHQAGVAPKGSTSFLIDNAFDDSTTYTVQVTARSAFGVGSAPAPTTITTTTPGAPANVSGLTAVNAGPRTRRWTWTANTEKNIRGYVYEVRTAASGSGTLKESGETKTTSHVYTENGLARTTNRYFRVQAINRSGVTSASWVEAVGLSANTVDGSAGGGDGGITGGTVGTSDAASSAFTDPHQNRSATNVSLGTSLTSVVTTTVTMNGGYVLVIVDGTIGVGSGWISSDFITCEIRRGTTVLKPEITCFSGVSGGRIAPFAFAWVDTSGVSGSQTFELRMKRSSSTTAAINADILAIEFKR